MKQNLILAVATLSVVAIAPSVSAQVAVSKDASSRLYVSGLTANTEYPVTMNSSVITRRLLANQCGLITVPAPSTTSTNPANSIIVGGTTVTPSSLDVKAIPRCVNGALDIPAPTNFITPRGQTILVGQTPNLAIEIQIESPRTRNFTTDSCGTLRVTNSSTFPVTAGSGFRVGGDATLYNVPTTESTPPVCAQGVKYVPSGEFPL